MKTRIFAAWLWMLVATAFGQEYFKIHPDHHIGVRPRTVDFEHMMLEVRFRPEQGQVRGKVTFRFRAVREVVRQVHLDGPGIEVGAVRVDGRKARYVQDAQGLTVFFEPPLRWGDGTHTLAVDYVATPQRGLYFIGWNDTAGRRRKLIWTQGQGIDNRHWFPCYDAPNDKLVTELKVHFPRGFEVRSNGTLVRKKRRGDTVMWHYRMEHPHASYLVMLGIGPYAVKEAMADGKVRMRFYYYADAPETVAPTYRYSVRHMNLLQRRLGVPYPWGRTYSQIPVEDFLYGAMENTTATVFTDYYLTDARGALDHPYWEVDAHELVHQWFGNYVTAISSAHSWLQESFATYYARWLMGRVRGPEAEEASRYRAQQNALRADRNNAYPILHRKAGSARAYSKGSCVLDMLQYVIGQADYDRVITAYLRRHAFGNVSTEDLARTFTETIGWDADTFFSQWLYKGGHPDYRIRKRLLYRHDTPVLAITVEQTQTITPYTTYYSLPAEFEIHLTDGTVWRRRYPMRPAATNVCWIDLPVGTRPRLVMFDPDARILKTLDFEKTPDEWKYQAEHARSVIKRREAVEALGSSPDGQDWLAARFAAEKSPFVLRAILAQLGGRLDAVTMPVFRAALRHPSVQVRKAALRHLPAVPPFRQALTALLADSSYQVVRSALSQLVAAFPADRWQFLDATRHQYGRQMEVRTRWLQYACDDSAERYLPELKAYASPSYEFRTRLNAFQALEARNYLDDTVADHLWDAAFHFNWRFRSRAQDLIRYYAVQMRHRPVLEAAIRRLPAGRRPRAWKILGSQ